MIEIREDEYLDPADGLLHCRKCKGPRQVVIADPFNRGSFKPRCVCPCQQEREHRHREAEERRQRMERIRRRKAQGLQDRYLYEYTFANDNGENPVMAKARAYVDHWSETFLLRHPLEAYPLLYPDAGKVPVLDGQQEKRPSVLDALQDKTKAAADHPAPDKGSGPRRHKPDKEAR